MAKHSKKTIEILVIFFISIIIINTLMNPIGVFENILNSLKLWLFKVYPPIFMFYIISNLILNLNILNNNLGLISKIFKFKNPKSSSIFLMSLLIGNPATSALIIENIKNKEIDIEDGNHLICISSFLNPLFIISFMASSNLYSQYTFFIILIHILSNFIIAFVISNDRKDNIIIKQETNNKNNSIQDFFESIEKANFLLIKISGIIVICNLVKYSLYNLLSSLKIKGMLINIIFSIIEVASGLNDIVSLKLPQAIVLSIIAFLVSFGGLAIHLQVYSVISNSSLKFKKYFYFRIIQGLLSFLICYLILTINLSNLSHIIYVCFSFILGIIILKILKRKKCRFSNL